MANHDYIYDTATVFGSAQTITTSAAMTNILDLKSAHHTPAKVVLKITSLKVSAGNELYVARVQVSSSATFASDIHTVAEMEFGDASVLAGDTDTPTGDYYLKVSNDLAGTNYRYMRVHWTNSGTSPSVTVTGFLDKVA